MCYINAFIHKTSPFNGNYHVALLSAMGSLLALHGSESALSAAFAAPVQVIPSRYHVFPRTSTQTAQYLPASRSASSMQEARCCIAGSNHELPYLWDFASLNFLYDPHIPSRRYFSDFFNFSASGFVYLFAFHKACKYHSSTIYFFHFL